MDDEDRQISFEKTIDKKLSRLLSESEKLGREKTGGKLEEDKVRGHIAKIFVYAFISIIPVMFVLVTWYNHNLPKGVSPLDVEKLLSLIGNFFAGSLGFVLGYYFKSQEANKG